MDKLIIQILIIFLFTASLFCDEFQKIDAMIFSNFETLETEFIQEKKISFLDNLVKITGNIRIEKPDILVWETITPIKQRITINKNKAIILDLENNESQTFKIKDIPVMQEFLPIMKNMFQGNITDLRDDFVINISKKNDYKIICEPKNKNIKAFIKKIEFVIDPKSKFIKTIYFEDPEEDYFTMSFFNTKI